jgi:hypothetical protein
MARRFSGPFILGDKMKIGDIVRYKENGHIGVIVERLVNIGMMGVDFSIIPNQDCDKYWDLNILPQKTGYRIVIEELELLNEQINKKRFLKVAND